MSDATDALGFTPNSAHEELAAEIVAAITKREGASPSAIVCLTRSVVSWPGGPSVVEGAVERGVGGPVVVATAIEDGVVDNGRVEVVLLRLACPDPPPHAERVTTAVRPRNGQVDLGCRRALMGTASHSTAAREGPPADCGLSTGSGPSQFANADRRPRILRPLPATGDGPISISS